jgi:chromosome segregation ATPase
MTLSEATLNEFTKTISSQLDELKKSHEEQKPAIVNLPTRMELETWKQRLDSLEAKVQTQAHELQGAKELREGVEAKLEDKTVQLQQVERKLEATAELLKETKWENRGLRVTLSGIQGQQEKYRQSFQKLHEERIKGILSGVPRVGGGVASSTSSTSGSVQDSSRNGSD